MEDAERESYLDIIKILLEEHMAKEQNMNQTYMMLLSTVLQQRQEPNSNVVFRELVCKKCGSNEYEVKEVLK